MDPRDTPPDNGVRTTLTSGSEGRLKVDAGGKKKKLKAIVGKYKKDGSGGPGFLNGIGNAIQGAENAVKGAAGSVFDKIMNRKSAQSTPQAAQPKPAAKSPLDNYAAYYDEIGKLNRGEYK